MRYHYRNANHRQLHELLVDEIGKRNDRGGLAWIALERTAMWEGVNTLRHERGKNPLPIEDVEKVERMAEGHTDYDTKFALYCTELVEGRP